VEEFSVAIAKRGTTSFYSAGREVSQKISYLEFRKRTEGQLRRDARGLAFPLSGRGPLFGYAPNFSPTCSYTSDIVITLYSDQASAWRCIVHRARRPGQRLIPDA
jgi:hypothetical protein